METSSLNYNLPAGLIAQTLKTGLITLGTRSWAKPTQQRLEKDTASIHLGMHVL